MNNTELISKVGAQIESLCKMRLEKSYRSNDGAVSLSTLNYIVESSVKDIVEAFTLLETVPTVELVDNHHGIYAMHSLACNYTLFNEDGVEQGGEGLKKLFHPDNPDYLEYEVSDYYVQKLNGTLWRCEWRDGDIIAVNPEAEWSEENDCWEIKAEEEKGRVTGNCPLCGAVTYVPKGA